LAKDPASRITLEGSVALDRNPDDPVWNWVSIAVSLDSVTNDFGADSFIALSRSGPIEVSWPIAAALHVEGLSAFPTMDGVCRVLTATGQLKTGFALLSTITPEQARELCSWSYKDQYRWCQDLANLIQSRLTPSSAGSP